MATTATTTTRALVVGGTNGVGYGLACRIAAQSTTSSVIISGRTKPQDIPHANIEFRPLEATSMRQIKQYTDAFKASSSAQSSSAQQQQQQSEPSQKLDYLIMSQGILSMAGRTETPEGIDRKMALHYYGKQLLLRELLPTLKEDAKVIIVYDGKLGSPDKLVWDDLDLKTNFSLGKAADHCISMNDAMIQHFAAEQKKKEGKGEAGNDTPARRHFVHAFPGVVNTGIWREMPWYLRPALRVLTPLFATSPEMCAKNLLEGTVERAAARGAEGLFWSNIDQKGRLVEGKAVWSEEQLKKVVDHTWEVIDRAFETKDAGS